MVALVSRLHYDSFDFNLPCTENCLPGLDQGYGIVVLRVMERQRGFILVLTYIRST